MNEPHEFTDLFHSSQLESTLDGIVAIDEHGTVFEWNPGAVRIFGRAREHAVGQPLAQLIIPPALRSSHERGLRAYCTSRIPHMIGRRVETEALHADGRTFPVELIVAPFETSGRTFFIAFIRDRTEQMKAMRDIDRLQMLYKAVLDAMPVQLAVFDPEARYRYVTPSAIHDPEIRKWIIGKTDAEYATRRGFDPGIAQQRMESILEVERNGTPLQFEEALPGPGGAQRHFLRFVTPVKDSAGAVTQVFGYGLDITDLKEAQRQKQQEASRLSSLIEHFHDAVLVEDEQHRLVNVNPSFCQLFGLPVPPDALLGTDCTRAAESAKGLFSDPEAFLAGIEDAHRLRTVSIGTELQLADGRTFERDYIPIVFGATVTGNMWLYRDVTDRKRAAEALRNSDMLNRALYRQAQETRGDLIRQLARAATRLTSMRSADELAAGVEELLEEFERVEYSALYLRTPGSEQLRLYFAKGFTEEERAAAEHSAMERHPGVVVRSGRMLHVPDVEADPNRQTVSSPRSFPVRSRLYLPIFGGGRCTGCIGLVSSQTNRFGQEDIEILSFLSTVTGTTYENIVLAEARRAAELELRLREQAIMSSNNGIVITDARLPDNPIIFINPAFERMTGYAADEVVGRNPRFLQGREVDQPGLSVLRGALRASRECTVVLRNYHKSGMPYWTELSISPILSQEGSVTHYVGIQTDITERIRSHERMRLAHDKAVEADRAKSDFVAMMSHEIRTPMNGVIGASELLATTRLTEAQRGYLDTISASGHHLLRIVNDILDLSKIEAGKLDLRFQSFALRAIVHEVVRLVSASASNKHIAVHEEVAETVPEHIVSDPIRLRQVLLNLAANAVKFTNEGTVTITVNVRQLPNEEPALLVTVRDTGIGMSPEVVEHIFEPFSQADTSDTRMYGGTGLGLTISARLVALLGGDIRVTSAPGQGSCFEINIPLVSEASESVAEPATMQPPGDVEHLQAGISALRILVAEDNVINRQLLQQMLGTWAVQADLVHDGAEALAAVQRTNYDIILMDIQMPMLDGLEATRRIRRLDLGDDQPVIVAITANAITGSAERCLDAGMDDFLSKPVRLTELETLLLRWADAQMRHAASIRRSQEVASDAVPDLLDEAMLASLRAMSKPGVNLLDDLVALMIEQAPGLFEEMDAGLACLDHQRIARASHRFAGSASSIGFAHVQKLCLEIERAADASDLASVDGLLSELRSTFDASQRRLTSGV